jgi:hypothetical protein
MRNLLEKHFNLALAVLLALSIFCGVRSLGLQQRQEFFFKITCAF